MSHAAELALLGLAVEKCAGPAIVLDTELRIIAGTPGIEHLLGGPLALGKRAPQVLCGKSHERPLADALARGESIATEIERPSRSGVSVLSVVSTPLRSGEQLRGHLLRLQPTESTSLPAEEWQGIVTGSESMRRLRRQVERVAPSNASVLVRGETGAGKELIARALHALSPRKGKPFAAINCAALPADLLESELFGHVRGAFTGAVRDHQGHFRAAEGGTLFLDEVAELPLAVQAKLLRVTQERVVVPVGASTPIPVDVRLISATHRSLRDEVTAGRFRADLLFRLRVIPLFLPSLRERPADIELLLHRFLAAQNAHGGSRKVEQVSPDALKILLQYSWPGNVRELQNVVQYAFLLGDGPILRESDLPDEVRGITVPPSNVPLPGDDGLSGEARRVARALERANGNRGRAASSLGISRSTLWRKMREYNLQA